jgi:hypothetical protein
MIIRPDFIFSYWIFGWFILYFTRIISINPKLWLIVAFWENIISVFVLFFKSKMYVFIRFFIVNLLIKVLPLYLIRNTKIHKTDIVYSVLIFVIYLLWLYINNFTIFTLYEIIYNSQISKTTNILPLSYVYDKIYHSLL